MSRCGRRFSNVLDPLAFQSAVSGLPMSLIKVPAAS